MRILAAALAVLLSPAGLAADIVQAITPGGATITLTDSECALKDQITNLPLRATWEEDGKVDEGCYDLRPPLVWMYFNDKTVVVAPMGAFSRVTEHSI